ncbi:MAG: Rpn family recombination-promoting nuclease/putative transposase [Planctomycetes bacterium]|nr:Rpn family recombination-promoting nuclease/putative transposase [Planctomycetota bacterium]MCB9886827.1 Rpn family recombination-promoting nuclease/putative transposase [Planctomycetota bacterium]
MPLRRDMVGESCVLPIRSHDALFRFVFGEPATAADLLRLCLPPAIVAAVDWNVLRALPGSFVDEALQERQADLLFVAPLGETEVLLHLLVEHKSSDDHFVALQTARYAGRVLDRWLDENPGARWLPPILPVVVHHGDRPMRAPRSLRELVDVRRVPAAAARLLRSFQPRRGFVLFDLAGRTAADLRALSTSVVTQITLLFLQRLQRASPGAAIDALLQWRDLIARLLDQARGQEVFLALFSWLLAGMPQVGAEVRRVVDEIDDSRVRETMKSALDELLEEGRQVGMQQGMQQGLQQGMQEGILAGRRAALLDLLRVRFGEVPSEIHSRVTAADAPRLAAWQRRAIEASALAEVFDIG